MIDFFTKLPLYKQIERLTQTKVTGLGLSVFRLFFSIILLVEVGKLFYFRHLYFDPVPYIVESELSFSLVLLAWLGVLTFGLLIGFKTKASAIINYVLVLVFFSSFTTLKYHFDSALIGISFMLMLLPVSTRLSLDSLIYKLKTLNEEEQNVRLVYYYFPVLLVLALQYFDSFFHKIVSEPWYKGLGVWLPASLPNQVYTNISWILNQQELVMSLGYFVLLFEVTFLFLLLVRKLRIWIVIIGICMHLGIALVFPIPTFGATYAGIYMLLLPIGFWNRLANRKGKHKEKPVLLFSAQDLLIHRLKIILNHFDVFNRISYKQANYVLEQIEFIPLASYNKLSGRKALKVAMQKTIILFPFAFVSSYKWFLGSAGILLACFKQVPPNKLKLEYRQAVKTNIIYFFLIYIIWGQVIKTLNSPLVIKLSHVSGLASVRNHLETIFLPFAVVNSKLLGITENLIYAGFSEGTYEVLGIEHSSSGAVKTWVPINEINGMASPMHFGRIGAITKSAVDSQFVYRRLIRITSFWARKNNISLDDAHFNILSKPIKIQFNWEKNYLNEQINKPWRQVGKLVWKEKKATLVFNKSF